MKQYICVVLFLSLTPCLFAQRDEVTEALGGMRGQVIGAVSTNVAKNGEGSTVELRNGSILHAFSRHMRPGNPTRQPNPDLWPAVVMQIVSHDGGHAWSDPQVMFRSATGDNAMQPGFVRMKNGELGVSYSQIDSLSSATKVFRYSQDDGRTWSSPILISPRSGYWTSAHDRMLRLSSGRILIPLNHKTAVKPEQVSTRVAYSDDNGRTWRLDRQDVTTNAMLPAFRKRFGGRDASGFWEASVAQLAGGKLLMIGRTYAGALYMSVSKDEGLTWSQPRPTNLRTGAAPGRLLRVPGSADLLVLWNSCCVDTNDSLLGERLTLSSAISTDDGLTWKWRRTIEAIAPGHGNNVAYPAITFIDARAFVTYRARTSDGGRLEMEEYLSILPISWFYAEKDCNSLGFRP